MRWRSGRQLTSFIRSHLLRGFLRMLWTNNPLLLIDIIMLALKLIIAIVNPSLILHHLLLIMQLLC